MFNIFGNKTKKKNLEELKRLKDKNKALYLKALEKYSKLKTS